MKKLLIAAATLLLLQAACSLPAALGAPGLAGAPPLAETATAPILSSGSVLQDTPLPGAAPTATAMPGKAPAATVDPRITFLLAQLRVYLETNPHIQKVDRLELKGSVLDLEITTVFAGQAEQAGVAYETAKAIAGGLSLAPKDQVDALMKSGKGTLRLRVNSSDAAWHFVSDSPLALLAGLQAGQVSQEAWVVASHYKPAP